MPTHPEKDNGHEPFIKVKKTHLRGFHSLSGVASFLGIPFAEFPQRFRQAKLLDFLDLNGTRDATTYGPRCPQPGNGGRERRKHLYEGITPSSTMPMSEFECLTLNVYTPWGLDGLQTKLPVVVWIHGGGWVFGDGNSEYDGKFLVEKAACLGKPFIFVSINYRLGYFGFLSSKELQDEATCNGEDGVANQGLNDQRLGLEWVQKYIHHFGGDPSNVTISGQSAGAWSALSHLVSPIPLGQRGLIMSAPVFSFQRPEEAQTTFDRLVASTGTPSSATSADKLVALRNLTEKQMIELVDGEILLRPVWDCKWFGHQEAPRRLDQITNFPKWVKELIVGWSKHETALTLPLWQTWSKEQLLTAFSSAVADPPLAKEIQKAYGFSDPSQDNVLNGILDFTADALYAIMPPLLGRKLNLPVYLYQFDQVDTWTQSFFHNYAYHCLDIALLFRMPAVAGTEAPKPIRATADAILETFTSFICGRKPWDNFGGASHIVMVFNGNSSGPVNWSEKEERLIRLLSTKEREDQFVEAGLMLVTSGSSKIYKVGVDQQ